MRVDVLGGARGGRKSWKKRWFVLKQGRESFLNIDDYIYIYIYETFSQSAVVINEGVVC